MEYKFQSKSLKLNLRSEADKSVFREIFLDRDYMAADDAIKKAKNCILDIGAHVGLFSMYARALNEKVKIFAYEPEIRNFEVLKWHFKENHIENIVAKNLAAASNDGSVRLFLSNDSHNHSLVNFDDKEAFVSVPSISLQKIFDRDLARYGIYFCDLIKMDCEGAEFEILKSVNSLLFDKIGSFFIEYHEYLPDMKALKLEKILQKNGFKTKKVSSRYDKRFGFIFAKK